MTLTFLGGATLELIKDVLVDVDNLVRKLSRCRIIHELAEDHRAAYDELNNAYQQNPPDQARIDAAEREWERVRATLLNRGGSSAAAPSQPDAVLAPPGTLRFCVAEP